MLRFSSCASEITIFLGSIPHKNIILTSLCSSQGSEIPTYASYGSPSLVLFVKPSLEAAKTFRTGRRSLSILFRPALPGNVSTSSDWASPKMGFTAYTPQDSHSSVI